MNKNSERLSRRKREGLFSAVSIGIFLILVGMFFVITPDLLDKIVSFFRDFQIMEVPRTGILLPAPATPHQHSIIYSVVKDFSLAWGVFLVVLLALRFIADSPLRKKAENLSDILFSFGVVYLVDSLLIRATQWFEFWAWILILAGVSLVIRAIFLAAVSMRPQ